MLCPVPRSTLFPYTTLFRSDDFSDVANFPNVEPFGHVSVGGTANGTLESIGDVDIFQLLLPADTPVRISVTRSEEHTSELQSLRHLVCRLLLEKKKQKQHII